MTIDIQLYAVYTDNRTWWWWSFVFRIIFLLLLSRVLSSVMLTKSSFDDYSTSVSFIFARLLALFMIQFPHDLCNFQTLRMSQQQRHHAAFGRSWSRRSIVTQNLRTNLFSVGVLAQALYQWVYFFHFLFPFLTFIACVSVLESLVVSPAIILLEFFRVSFYYVGAALYFKVQWIRFSCSQSVV